MRIMFLSADLCDGGAQRVTATMANKLAEFGNEVSLVVFYRSERDYHISEKLNTIYMFNDNREYQSVSHIKRLLLIRRIVKQIKPEVGIGFLQAGYALYFSTLGLNIPRVASARVAPLKLIDAKGLSATITRYWFRRADAVVLQNNEQMNQAIKCKWNKKIVIPNPVNDKVLESELPKYNDICKKIIMVGRLAKQKNYSMAIKAMKVIHERHPQIELDIYGEGELKEQLVAEIEENKLERVVSLKGWSSNIIEVYREYDAYLLSSNFEGQPNSLMEAMGIGLPCISTMCETGPKDLIENNTNGILIETNNLEQLISAIEKLVSMNAFERMKLGQSARKMIHNDYNAEAIAMKWEQLFRTVVNK